MSVTMGRPSRFVGPAVTSRITNGRLRTSLGRILRRLGACGPENLLYLLDYIRMPRRYVLGFTGIVSEVVEFDGGLQPVAHCFPITHANCLVKPLAVMRLPIKRRMLFLGLPEQRGQDGNAVELSNRFGVYQLHDRRQDIPESPHLVADAGRLGIHTDQACRDLGELHVGLCAADLCHRDVSGPSSSELSVL